MNLVMDDMLPYPIEDDEPACGFEHPVLVGNFCEKPEAHRDFGTEHEDAAGNTWRGAPDYDS